MKTRTLFLLGLGGVFAYLMYKGREPAVIAEEDTYTAPVDPNATPDRPITMDDLQLFVPLPIRGQYDAPEIGIL